jgi:uncharacterized iron-regulated membrane protein
MNAGRHAAGDGSFARSASGAMTRGIVLIVVALIIGLVLMRTAIDGDTIEASSVAEITTTTAATTETTETTDAVTTETSAVEGTTDTTPAETTDSTVAESTDTSAAPDPGDSAVFVARSPNEVRVQVANTTTTRGAAGAQTSVLLAEGYTTLTPTNWTSGVLNVSKVHHIDGYLLEAQAVAKALGLDEVADVFAMPANVANEIGEFEDPQVLILVGVDLAGS